MDQPLVLEPVGDELRHRDEGETMLLGEPLEIGAARHRAVRIEDLADHTRGIQPGEPREIDACFGLADALQHTAATRPERKDVTGPPQIARYRRGIDRDANRRGPVGSRNPGRDAEPRCGIDADRKRRFVRFVVVLGHLRQPEGLATLGRQRHADEAARVRRHEVDHLGRHLFGRADQIPLVLAPLVIGYDDELAGSNIRDRLFYCAERHSCLTYFPRTSASTCTRSPLPSFPSVVCSRVNGTTDTCTTPGRGMAFTVMLTPSIVIAPCNTVVSATSSGTLISSIHAFSFDAFPFDAVASTTPIPSTWPWTKCPPNRSPARSARSRLTLRPFFHSPISVRPSVV